MTAKIETHRTEETNVDVQQITVEKKGLFKRASEGAIEFASNHPVTAAVATMATYDAAKTVVAPQLAKGARFVSGKVGGLLGRKAAQAAVGSTGEQVAHLLGGIVKTIF